MIIKYKIMIIVKLFNQILFYSVQVYWAKFNENGSFYASGGADSNIVIYDVKAGKVL